MVLLEEPLGWCYGNQTDGKTRGRERSGHYAWMNINEHLLSVALPSVYRVHTCFFSVSASKVFVFVSGEDRHEACRRVAIVIITINMTGL